MVILLLGFGLIVKAEECVGHEKDQIVSLKEIYPWILTTVREEEARKKNKYRVKTADRKPSNDPNLEGGLP